MAEIEHDVYRNEAGEPVTITHEQYKAFWHAIRVWQEVARDDRGEPIKFNEPNVAKSRLLGRMLIDGRPPLDEVPPRWFGAPGYHLAEPELDHFYIGVSPQIALLEAPQSED
jgi:hypothetical protein